MALKVMDMINDLVVHLGEVQDDITKLNKRLEGYLAMLHAVKKNLEADKSAKEQELTATDKKGKTILVVDDDEDIRAMIKTFLELEGYDVLCAEDGFTGLEFVLKHRPDLILLDILMPRMDGIEFCDTVAQDPNTRDIPVVMLTAKNVEDDRKTAYFVGAKAYLTKPFNQQEVLTVIENLLK